MIAFLIGRGESTHAYTHTHTCMHEYYVKMEGKTRGMQARDF